MSSSSSISESTLPIKPRTNENIYLFIPNLIGYTRIILAAASLTYMSTHPKFCTLTYLISCLLDAVDGMAARALGQTSKLGAILDMVTDRFVLIYLFILLLFKEDLRFTDVFFFFFVIRI